MARVWDTVPDDKIDLPFTSKVSFAAPASLFFWIKSSNDVGQAVFASTQAADGNHFFMFAIGPATGLLTDELFVVVRDDNTTGAQARAGYTTATRSELFDGNWHSICATSNGSAWTLYLDGQSKTVTPGGSSGNDGLFTDVTSADTVQIGTRTVASSEAAYLDGGTLGELAIWNVALGATEVAALHDGTNPFRMRTQAIQAYYPLYGSSTTEIDLSGNGNNGTVTGALPADGPPVGRPWPAPVWNPYPTPAVATSIFPEKHDIILADTNFDIVLADSV